MRKSEQLMPEQLNISDENTLREVENKRKEIRGSFDEIERMIRELSGEEFLPETKLAKETIIREEMNLFEKMRGEAKNIAKALILITALSAMPKMPQEAEAGIFSWLKGGQKIEETTKAEEVGQKGPYYGIEDREISREENRQENKEFDKIEIGEQWIKPYRGHKGGQCPEWTKRDKFWTDKDEEGEEYVYSIGCIEGSMHSPLSWHKEIAVDLGRIEILKQLKLRLKEEFKVKLLADGKQELVESKYFDELLDSCLEKAVGKEINLIGVMAEESFTQEVYEKVSSKEVRFLRYETLALCRQPKDFFDFAYKQLIRNFKEAVKELREELEQELEQD